MRFENLFKDDHAYNAKLANKYILIIKTTKDEKRKQDNCLLLFQMMKEIVNKNINNFHALCRNGGAVSFTEKKQYNELVNDCYIIFNKSLSLYKISKTNNFYFYFNKAMSRTFYKEYLKDYKKNLAEVDTGESYEHTGSYEQHLDAEMILSSLKFTSVQKDIIRSKMSGQKFEDFLNLNPEVNSVLYYRNLKAIKEILTNNKQELL